MEFKDLHCDYSLYKNFYVVAKTGSFSKAAKALFLTQPTISYNIKKLENELGFKLFFRDSRNINLTPEGTKLFKYVESAHNTLISAENEIKGSSILNEGEILIGIPTNFYIKDICKVIKQFKQTYKKIKISLYFRPTQELFEMLDAHKIDIIFCFYKSTKNKSNSTNEIRFFPESHICIAGLKSIVENADYTQLDYILPNVHTTMRNHIDQFFFDIQFKPNITIETFTIESTLDFVNSGFGVGLFYQDYIQNYIDSGLLKIVNFNKEIPKISRCFIYKKNFVDYATKTMIDCLTQYSKEN